MALDKRAEDIGWVLNRAAELEAKDLNALEHQLEWQPLLDAAEEAGLSREAVLTALRERLSDKAEEWVSGDLVFAQSPDRRWYAAVFDSRVREGIKVRYLHGGEGVLDLEKVQRFALAPGQSVEANGSFKVWSPSQIVRFNPDSRSVTIKTWGNEELVPLERIRLPAESALKRALAQHPWHHLAITALSGAGIGALITFLLTR